MKILAIGAHIDDIELGCGGTLAKAIQNNHEVMAVILTRSGYTNLNGEQQRYNEQACKEEINAFNILNIQNYIIHDFSTKDIMFNSLTVEAIEKDIKSFNPDIIFTHFPFDTHQAHEAVAKATMAAARNNNTVIFYEPLNPRAKTLIPFEPNLFVNIDKTIVYKQEALRQHISEYKKFGSENWINKITSRCLYRGSEIACQYAEAFHINRITLNFDKLTSL